MSVRRLAAPPRPMLWVLAICVLAFVLRVVATALFEGLRAGPNEGAMYDGVEYEAIASNLVRHQEYSVSPGRPTSFRAPGFPVALASVYALFGNGNYLAAHLFFCMVGAALCLATYLVARETIGGWAAMLAAAFVAVYPNLMYYAIHFASEPLFTLLLTFAIWGVLRAVRTRRAGTYFVSGVVLGLAALVRPVAFYFAPFFAVAILWTERRRLRPALGAVVLVTAGVVAPVAPWTIRNYVVHDRPLLLASNGGSTFWGANNQVVLDDPALRGAWVSTERLGPDKAVVRRLPNEVDRDRAEWELGKAFLRSHWREIPRLVWYKLYAMWTPVSTSPNALFNLVLQVSYGAALPFMLLGLVLFVRHRGATDPDLLILLAPVVATTAASLAFYGSARFRSTIEPVLLVFAAAAVHAMAARLARPATTPVSEAAPARH